MSIEFNAWPKTPHLRRNVMITEKIDGTNAAIIVTEDGRVGTQSRKRLITPESDNFGFAAWVAEHAENLADTLGPGHHYGEWWGHKIQRGYGRLKGDRQFSLFNVGRYIDVPLENVPGLDLVPVLAAGILSDRLIEETLTDLAGYGSVAAPGYDHPEGVIVYHEDARQVFKVLIEQDHLPKELAK